MLTKLFTYFIKKKFIRFCLSGAIATLVDVSLLYVFTEFIGIWYLTSATLSFIIGTLIHYAISSFWVFESRHKTLKQYLIFVLVQTVGLAINLLVIFILVEYFNWWYIFGKLIAVVIGVMWNYFANLKITFKNKIKENINEQNNHPAHLQ